VAHNVLDTAHIGRTVLLSSTVHNNTSSLDLLRSKGEKAFLTFDGKTIILRDWP